MRGAFQSSRFCHCIVEYASKVFPDRLLFQCMLTVDHEADGTVRDSKISSMICNTVSQLHVHSRPD